MVRSIREQNWCWQEKKVLRLLRSLYLGSDLAKMKYLYFTITEIDNDFNGKPIKYYTRTIATYSGLSKAFIPTGLKELEKLNIINIIEDREKGKFKGKSLYFTPKLIEDKPVDKTATKLTIPKKERITVAGKPVNGFSHTSEESLCSEESLLSSPERKKEEKVSPERSFLKAYKEIYGSDYNIKPKENTFLSAYKEDCQELSKDFDALPAYIKYLTEEEKLNGLKYLTLTLFLKGNNDRLQKLHSFRLYGTDDLGEIMEAKEREKYNIDIAKQEAINEEYSELKKQMPDDKTFYNWAKQNEDNRAKWNKYNRAFSTDERLIGIELMKDYLKEY